MGYATSTKTLSHMHSKDNRYAWHKQALGKGTSYFFGTDWGGWGFERSTFIGPLYSKEEANALSTYQILFCPVFRHDPDFMFTNVISKADRDNLLARAIPELSYPIGARSLPELRNNSTTRDFDLNTEDFRRDDQIWPTRLFDYNDDGERPKRWLHSDIVNVVHFYNFKLYKRLVEIGKLHEVETD